MKRATYIFTLLLFAITTNAQISFSRSQGGTMEMERFGGYINQGSTLFREYITLNDSSCPLLINPDVGVEPEFIEKEYFWFTAKGNIFPLEPITAYEIHHILYDVFGRHIKSLINYEITDIDKPKSFEKDEFFERKTNWQAFPNEARLYWFCVSYVANVRTKEDKIWRYDPSRIMSELNSNQIPFEDEFSPSHKQDKFKYDKSLTLLGQSP